MAKVKNLRGRIWTPNELRESALVPVDEEKCFATNLENLALTFDFKSNIQNTLFNTIIII